MAVLGLKQQPASRFVRPSLKSVALFVFVGLAALLIGVGVAFLPPSFSLGFGGLLLLPVAVFVVWMAPKVESIPEKWLRWLLFASIFAYFVWPRNAFIPISALPVKHPQKMVYFGLLGIWFFLLFKCSPLRERLGERLKMVPWLGWAWLMFALWQVVAAFAGDETLYSMFRWTIDLTTIYLLFPLALSILRDEQDVRRLIYILIAAAVINVLYALPEFAMRRNPFERFITLSDIDPAMARNIMAAKLRGGSYRAQASFDHPLLFAEYLLLVIPFAGMAALYGAPKLRKWMVLATLMMAGGLVLSRSRVALVAGMLAAGILVVLILLNSARGAKRNPWPLIILFFTVPVVLGVVYLLLGKVGSITAGRTAVEASSSNARAAMLWEGTALLFDSPIFGYGPGLGALALNFRNPDGVLTLDNYLLILALDSGIISVLLFLGIVVWVAYVSFRQSFRNLGSTDLLQPLVASIAAFLTVKAVLGTGLNNLMLPLFMACLVVLIFPVKDKSNEGI